MMRAYAAKKGGDPMSNLTEATDITPPWLNPNFGYK